MPDTDVAPNVQNFWQKLEAGLAEFAAGTTVKIEEDTKGVDVSFTANNPFGTKYTFKVNGKISLVGKPQ